MKTGMDKALDRYCIGRQIIGMGYYCGLHSTARSIITQKTYRDIIRSYKKP
jgi:hypothetical protein